MRDPETGAPYGTAYWDERGRRVTEDLEGDDSELIMDRMLPFVRDAVDDGRPFLAVVWFHTPHLPVVASAADRAPYAHLDERLQHYHGALSAMDRQIGRLRAELTRLGVDRDTLVWFCSDNGPEGSAQTPWGSTGGLRGRKRSLYEGGLRVPAVLEWPRRIAPGSVSDTPTVTTDMLPTVCRALDVSMFLPGLFSPRFPPQQDGAGLLLGDTRDDPRPRHARRLPIGFESRERVALVDGDFKLVGTLGAPDESGVRPVTERELYDLALDPGETTDLVARDGPRLEAMVAMLDWWRARRDGRPRQPFPTWPVAVDAEDSRSLVSTEQGTQRCPGCLARREVVRSAGALRVLELERPDVALWIAEQVPGHEHAWVDIGCWGADVPGEATTIMCLASRPMASVSPQDWHAYLWNLPADERASEVAAATRDGRQVEQRVAAWREARGDG